MSLRSNPNTGDDRRLRNGEECTMGDEVMNYSNGEGVGREGMKGRNECEYRVAMSFECPDAPIQKSAPVVTPRECTPEDTKQCDDLVADTVWDTCRSLIDAAFGVDENGENLMMEACKS